MKWVNEIGKIFWGSSEIGKVLYGDSVVFNAGDTPTPGPLVFYDYLKGDGTAYIDIDKSADSTISSNAKVLTCVARPITRNGYIAGLRYKVNDADVTASGVGLYLQSNGRNVRFYGYGAYTTIAAYSSSSIYKIEYRDGTPGSIIGYRDNVQAVSKSYTIQLQPIISLFDFSAYEFTTGEFTHTTDCRDAGYVWSVKITDSVTGNDILNLRPCTYYGEAGLWDTVSEVFYGNSNSSGTFTVGNN